jgi:hypothetical protein
MEALEVARKYRRMDFRKSKPWSKPAFKKQTAYEYEKLAGGREEHAQKTAKCA